MNCQDATTALSAELDRELGRGERRALFEHLEGCALCRARRVRMADVDRALRGSRERAIGAPVRLRGRIEALVAPAPPRRQWRWPAVVVMAAAAGAAIMFLALRPPAVGVVVASLQGDDDGAILVGAGVAARARAPGESLRAGEVVRASGGPGVVRVGKRTRARLENGAAIVLGRPRDAIVVARGVVGFEVARGGEAVTVQPSEGTSVSASEARFSVGPREVRVEAGRAEVAGRRTIVIAEAGDIVAVAVGQPPRKVASGDLPRVALAPEARERQVKTRATTELPAHIERQAQGHAAAGAATQATDVAGSPGGPVASPRQAEIAPDAAFVVQGVVEVEGGGSFVEGMPSGACADVRRAALAVKDGRVANAVVLLDGPKQLRYRDIPPLRITLDECGLSPRAVAFHRHQRVDITNTTSAMARFRAWAGSRVILAWGVTASSVGPFPLTIENAYDLSAGEDVADQRAPRAQVHVHTGPATTSDENGRFVLTLVQAGAGVLRVVHPMLGTRAIPVDVGPGMAEVRVVLPARSTEPAAPPVAPAAPVEAPRAPLLSRAGANECKIALRGDSDVVKACQAGGIKRAKQVMKSMAKLAKEGGMKTDCDSCHQNEEDWALTSNAETDFKKMLEVVAKAKK